MEVQFRTSKLRKQYEDHQKAERAYGISIGRRYIARINIIKLAHDIDELRRMPGLRCHALEGKRQGQHALNLDGFYRLIFTLVDERCEIVCIEEVSKHYDD